MGDFHPPSLVPPMGCPRTPTSSPSSDIPSGFSINHFVYICVVSLAQLRSLSCQIEFQTKMFSPLEKHVAVPVVHPKTRAEVWRLRWSTL